MKSIFVLCVAFVVLETINGQVIRSLSPNVIGNFGCGCGCNSLPPFIAPISPCADIITPCGTNVIAPIPPCSTNVIAPISPCATNVIAPSQILTPYGNLMGGPTVITQQPSVASSLADTLSLLTVSSLLAESLPLGSNVIVAPSCGGCGGYFY